MKKSHRKDVMIARIIFAAMCIALIAIIAGVVMLVRAHRSKPTPNQVTQQTQSQMQDTTRNDVIDVPDTQDTQVAEMTYMWTTDGVNLRSEPNTDCDVVTILEMGTQVRMIGEEDGWVKVSYNDQEGYIRADFLTTEQ
ncbi:MAG: SH3 domain-containing protein [Lachnobacterium sp.]|nr:SH3 domain-containing protein [Lachnobacterium sp.]MCI7533190.1 SH3 domain-containing protein [Lachnobacterium sp.]MDD7712750.1 SH3 domain-containing protein [Lachnobacterium sp.]MDY5460097.1 SH3 domain-containing protein [Agathobacter sp.]